MRYSNVLEFLDSDWTGIYESLRTETSEPGSYDHWCHELYLETRNQIIAEVSAVAFEMRADGNPYWQADDFAIYQAIDRYFLYSLGVNEFVLDSPYTFIQNMWVL